MPLDFIGNVFGSAISAAASAANTKQVNEANLKIAEMTNKANRELVELQNKAAKEESELAYQRSKPANQVANLTAAGMSRSGAINTLNGGGSYTPAPVNTSQDSAPQMQTADLTALANIGQGLDNIAQRKHEEKMAKMQIAAQKEENAANRQNAKDIAQLQADTTKETATNRLEWEKKVYAEMSPYQKREYDAKISQINASKALTEAQKDDLRYRILEYQSSEFSNARKAEALLRGIEADLGYAINKYEFDSFINKYYVREDNGDLKPKSWISNAQEVQDGAREIWNTIFELIPLRTLSEVLGMSGQQADVAAKFAKFVK